MPIKRRLIECECGQTFVEGPNNQLEGEVIYGPWKLRGNRPRGSKSPTNGDILVAFFVRTVQCGKCKGELLREQKQYDITPPAADNEDPVTTISNREYVMAKTASESAIDLYSINKKPSDSDEELVEDVAGLGTKKR